MCKLFIDYYYPSRLFDILTSKPDGKYLEVLELTIYAAKNENLDLYNACKDYISTLVYSTRTIVKQPDLIKEITARFLKDASKVNTPDFMKSNVAGIEFYFSQPILNYGLMWRTLQRQINNENFDWVMNYWEYADQYYTYKLKQFNSEDGCKIEDERTKFKEFHIAMGAMLLYSGKNEWLKQMMRFTNQLPPRYELALCSFVEIFEWLIYFNDLLKDAHNQMTLEIQYPLTKHGGVQADFITYSYVVKYMTYSMLFLDEIDYNVRYMDPLTHPLTCNQDDVNNGIRIIPTNEQYIRLAEQLKNAVLDVNKIAKKTEEIENQILGVINSYISECKYVIEQALDKREWSIEKEKLFKDQLTAEFEKQSNILIKSTDSAISEKDEFENTAKCIVKIGTNDIYEGDYRYSINLEAVIISSLIRDIQADYNKIFIRNHTTLTYTIRYEDIWVALEKLCLTEEFVVVGFGVHIDKTIAIQIRASVKNVVAHNSYIFILKKSMLPYVKFHRKETKSLSPLNDTDSYLYTNLEALKDESTSNENNLNLEVLVNYKLIVPATIMKYIRIRVFWDVTNKTFDLDKIVEVGNYL